MRRSIRKAGVACGTVFASAALAITTATGAEAVTTAVAVGGLGTPDMHEVVIAPLLGGKLDRENVILDGVEWPATAGAPGSSQLTLGQSITVGITNLNTHFDAALDRLSPGEQFTVVGFSAGSLVVNDFMRALALESDAPTKDQVKFILVADSSRQALIKSGSKYNPRYDYTYLPAAETIYDIDVVTGEYDGAADLPDRWWNFLALVNAMAGGIFVHVPMMFSDYEAVTPDENITTVTNSKGGVTTTYLVPTKTLPIVQLLPFLKPREAELKAKIDAAYTRNDDRLAATSSVARTSSLATTSSVVETADVETDDAADVQEAVEVTTVSDDAADDEGSTKSRGSENADADVDADDVSSTDDEAEAQEDADAADTADADSADADSAETDSDAADSTDSDSSASASSDGSGSTDSGSSE
ncbi:PE-PPE domain-containing protein [Mycobacterium sp. ITM-2017-0098]|nr:PE-PPE domain-containing protein [Mycobacterium sp. ITM-2017-0098]